MNEEEGLMHGGDRSGKYVKTRSGTCNKDDPEDMVQYTHLCPKNDIIYTLISKNDTIYTFMLIKW